MSERPACLLPENVRPQEYKLHFRPDLTNFTFEGIAEIDIEILEPSQEIILHSADLKIDSALLYLPYSYPDYVRKPKEVALNPEKQTLTLTFPSEQPVGKATLVVTFSGELNDQLCGFYRSKYHLPSGEERYMATTQFEAIDARGAFPCWDEPDKKAVFRVSLTIPRDLVAISNMPIVREENVAGEMKLVNFAPTPRMSTYLLAMLVGEFEWIEGRTQDGVLVRVCTTPGKKELGQFALDEAIKTLEFFGGYFETKYPLPKCDLATAPDFGAGAMENWGAITFRENNLLIDPKNSASTTLERASLVIRHEIAHMWFGDLVTMKWWDGLWLNEGFADFMELVSARALHPEWRPEDKFVSEDVIAALHADALKSSRKIHVPVNSDEEIAETFDAIAYFKGSAVIRMLEQFLDPEVFRRGIARYMKKHAYGNTNPEDLAASLEEESGKPIKHMLEEWITKVGYPVIRCEKLGHEKGNTKIRLSQERFLYERDATDQSLWPVPVGIRSSRGAEKEFVLLDDQESVFTLKGEISGEDWIKLNADITGFFRVYYAPEELLKFRPAIETGTLNVRDRMGLCDDTFALAKAGHYPTSVFLDLLSAYRNEKDLRVWLIILMHLEELTLLLTKDPAAVDLQMYIRALLSPIADRLGWDEKPGEEHQDKILRGKILKALGHAGDRETMEQTKIRFVKYLVNRESLVPDLRRAVYGIIASIGGPLMHTNILRLYQEASLQEEKERLLGALGEFQDRELLLKTLNFFLTPEVRSQDVYIALRTIAKNPHGRDLTWQFVKEQWDKFHKMYDKGKLLGRVISAVCSPLASLDDEADVRSFFEAHPVPNAKRTIEQALESIRVNARWLERDRTSLAEWFANRSF